MYEMLEQTLRSTWPVRSSDRLLPHHLVKLIARYRHLTTNERLSDPLTSVKASWNRNFSSTLYVLSDRTRHPAHQGK